jgi:antitoxin (DNA-binding transcriptional repressor) of toxin-antitoxin stability system
METITVGIREFRDNLSAYLLESTAPIAITMRGDTIGHFIPAPRKRSEADRTALKRASAKLDALLAERGLTERKLVADFKRWRKAKRRSLRK